MNYDEIIIQQSLVCQHMFEILVFMGYSRRKLNYHERITLSNLTYMMSMIDLVAVSLETLKIDSVCSFEKDFTILILMNHLMLLYLIINQVDSCHGCVSYPLT